MSALEKGTLVIHGFRFLRDIHSSLNPWDNALSALLYPYILSICSHASTKSGWHDVLIIESLLPWKYMKIRALGTGTTGTCTLRVGESKVCQCQLPGRYSIPHSPYIVYGFGVRAILVPWQWLMLHHHHLEFPYDLSFRSYQMTSFWVRSCWCLANAWFTHGRSKICKSWHQPARFAVAHGGSTLPLYDGSILDITQMLQLDILDLEAIRTLDICNRCRRVVLLSHLESL